MARSFRKSYAAPGLAPGVPGGGCGNADGLAHGERRLSGCRGMPGKATIETTAQAYGNARIGGRVACQTRRQGLQLIAQESIACHALLHARLARKLVARQQV